MGNEFSKQSSNSAEYFGDTRDFWWNRDFIELMATRRRLAEVRDVLDVGCGVGHWGALLGAVLPQEARVTVHRARPRGCARLSERQGVPCRAAVRLARVSGTKHASSVARAPA